MVRCRIHSERGVNSLGSPWQTCVSPAMDVMPKIASAADRRGKIVDERLVVLAEWRVVNCTQVESGDRDLYFRPSHGCYWLSAMKQNTGGYRRDCSMILVQPTGKTSRHDFRHEHADERILEEPHTFQEN